MYFISILFLTILIPSIQSAKPTLKLTFTPDEKYFANGHHVDISCEVINPTETTEQPQLWHIDSKTGKQTAVSRLLLNTPSDDAPEMFKQNKNRRLEYIKKNHLRLKHLQVEDSARYECNCPDCEEPLTKQTKELQVMKTVEPKWQFGPGWPLQENAKTTLKCTADDFYPYVGYRIVRNHHEIHNEGKATIPTGSTYPQKFAWEATVTPTAEWHNQTLRCTVIQGNSEQHIIKQLDVLFTPRFIKCEEKQHVDSAKEKATIECSYAGNPPPTVVWLRQTDDKPITSDPSIIIQSIDDLNGKYKSIVTFDRDKLVATPMTTTTKPSNGQGESKVNGESYYQQLLSGGFVVKLTYNNEDKEIRKINIVSDASQARSASVDSSTRNIENLSTSIILFSFSIILYVVHHH